MSYMAARNRLIRIPLATYQKMFNLSREERREVTQVIWPKPRPEAVGSMG